MDSLKALRTSNDFVDHISLHFLGKEFLEALEKDDPEWEKSWSDIRDKLVKINEEMVMLTEKCADEEKILWVVGY